MRRNFFSIRMTRLRGYVYGGQARTARMNRMFYAKIAMRGACTESPREWRNTAGAYLVQAPACHAWTPGEGRAVPPVYPRACEGTPSFTQIAIFAKKHPIKPVNL